MPEVPGTGENVNFNGYELILPVFVIVNVGLLRSKGLYDSLIVLSSDPDNYLPIFTDEDLADRMIEAKGISTCVPMKVRNTHELEQLVTTCGWYGGMKYVAIDPTDPSNSPDYRNVACRACDLIAALMLKNRS